MRFSNSGAVDLVEVAYELSDEEPAWLARLVEAASPLLGDGFGTMAVTGRVSPSGAFELDTFAGPNELLRMQASVLSELPKPVVVSDPRTGVHFLSKRYEECPADLAIWRRHLGLARDGLKLTALDTDRRMIYFFAAKKHAKVIRHGEQLKWKMLAAHLSSALRLRRALRAKSSLPSSTHRDLPLDADAVIDPRTFALTDAVGPATTKSASAKLREAAAQVDRARAELTQSDSDEAFAAWHALVSARWSMVDWFDSDNRRYILAMPNEPDIGDPRKLTQREAQVAGYAALGTTHKLIGYRLGISRARVTVLMRSIMRKLGVRTQPELVARLNPFGRAFAPSAPNRRSEWENLG